MTAPLIGLSTSRENRNKRVPIISVTEAYVQAVLRAGGIPVLIPVGVPAEQLAQLFPRLQGVLLTGGGDIDPRLFNGKAHPRVYGIDEGRDALEISLVKHAVEHAVPFFGICRGIQVINVAMGGSLYTDIADQLPGAIKHDHFLDDEPRDYLAHSVRLQNGSRLNSILGAAEAAANSLHHQGVERVAPGLVPTAWAPDGLVEGVELPGHPFGLAVQWHPEWLPDIAPMQALFRAFVAAAG